MLEGRGEGGRAARGAARPERAGMRILVRGIVQGVGMRPFVYRLARAEGLGGSVRNDAHGVAIELFGGRAALARFLRRLRAERPAPARLEAVWTEPIPPRAATRFRIEESDPVTDGARRVTIPPDLATCPACLAEVRDPANRRYRYPFTNCTECGPRFTVVCGVPYDRARTTMAPFTLCPACRREYEDPADRRFHAEPNACPACGPHLVLVRPEGTTVAERDAALVAAAHALAAGRIVAVKGLGGFHLACDARSSAAVRALRERKRREAKPLAVMVADLAAAARLAEIGPAERALLAGPERPIVLAPRRDDAALAPEVAPDGALLGLLLPYTPLHHLLLDAAGCPLVMTSGNLAEEPIAQRDEDALARLGPVADLLLLHDRRIETRADDSVTRVVAGRPLVLRRSRGYAPRAVALGTVARPTLACGALLKNTFCLASGRAAYLGAHVGDLENLDVLEWYEESIRRLERFLRVTPEVIAHDLHPEYLSTRYALERARREGLTAVAVQHHHAHAAACMAENGLDGEVLALAWDGSGHGTDGTAWGGELLLATYAGFERVATLRPIALPGGDRAVREPWRVAIAALDDAFDGAPPALPFLDRVPPARVATVRSMIAQGVKSPPAHGVGRLFDAVGALALGRTDARYEGQVALALEGACDADDRGRYPYAIDERAEPWQLDWRPIVRAAAEDLVAGRPAARVASRFHGALAAAAADLVSRAASRYGPRPVVLSGGCFQNARLVEGILSWLAGQPVATHREVPPGDGGIALGQAVVAQARARLA